MSVHDVYTHGHSEDFNFMTFVVCSWHVSLQRNISDYLHRVSPADDLLTSHL